MEYSNLEFRIARIDRFNYLALKSKLIDLYIDTFTKGEYSQHIDFKTAESTIDELIENGFGNIVLYDTQPIAFALATKLLNDKEFPLNDINNIQVDNAIYIAEVVVNNNFRRKGLATALINSLLYIEDNNYTGAVIRVWENNVPALKLYKKLGFKHIADIIQNKKSSPFDEFQMRKIYLYKKLTS